MACNVLFLSSRNAARSIVAEALLNGLGGGRFRGFSAGSAPLGTLHPLALELLEHAGYRTHGLRSKSWNEFTAGEAPSMDFVITLADHDFPESAPIFRGRPVTAEWHVRNVAALKGGDDDRREAFRRMFHALGRRVQHLTALPLESVDKRALRTAVRQIGSF